MVSVRPNVGCSTRLTLDVVLKGMGDEFLRKYVSIVEGEKDPRNLLMAFSIARVVLIEWEAKSYIEVSETWLWTGPCLKPGNVQ